MKIFLSVIAAAMAIAPSCAFAQAAPAPPPPVNSVVVGSYFYNVPSTTLTRATNTTTYTAKTTVCQSASVACTPLTIPVGNANGGRGFINHIFLLKSGSTTTNANFTIWFFSAAPGVASPVQEDNVGYVGPRIADMPNYIGSAACATPVVTSDTSSGVWYECTLSNPNSAGFLVFNATSSTNSIQALISVTAAYAPASAETFNIYASGGY